MEFDNDLFISYAHIDDQSPIEGKRGWVSELHRALEVRVAQLLGEEPKIWRDLKLAGSGVASGALLGQVPTVALVAAVLTPRYTRSEGCAREIHELARAAEQSGGVRVANKTRLFKIVKTPVPREEEPEELRDTLGYEFFTLDPASGRMRELGHELDEETRRLYWARLDDLAYDVAELLRTLRARSTERVEPAPPASDLPAVYLAETSFDLKEERDAVRRDLLRRGYRVLPEQPLPLVAAELEAFVAEALAQCRLSIHPVGRNYGLVPDGSRDSAVVLQNELAIARGAAGDLLRLVWLPPGLEIEDERQKAFVELLRSDPRIQHGADLLEKPVEDLKTVIERKLDELRRPAPERSEATGVVRLYLICDRDDGETVKPLEDYLFDQGYEVITPIFEGDETQVRLDHEENLCHCDAALVYYGAGSELWLRSKLRELQKSAGLGRAAPFLAKGIYVAPPDTPRKQRLRTREATVVRQGIGFAPDVLEPFLRELAREGGG